MNSFNPQIHGKELLFSKYGVISIKEEDPTLNLALQDEGIIRGFTIIFMENNHAISIECDVYKMKNNGSFASPKTRGTCVYDIFRLWTHLGHNTHHAKDPFKCKAFLTALNEMFNSEEDTYVLVRS